MIFPLFGLAVALKAVIHLPQQLRHFLVAEGMSVSAQFVGQRPGAFTGPAQRRLRIATRQGLNQRFQQLWQFGVLLDQRTAPTSRATDAFGWQGWALQFPDTFHDSDPREAAGPADQRHPAIADLRRFGGGQHSPRAFVKVRPEIAQLPPYIPQRYHAPKDAMARLSCKCYLLTAPN